MHWQAVGMTGVERRALAGPARRDGVEHGGPAHVDHRPAVAARRRADGGRAAVPGSAEVDFRLVLTSPRRRARHTAELTGFADAEVTDDLAEWAYGDYEGLTTPQIRESVPGWTVWSHPSPGGETAAEVAARCDRVVARARDDGRPHPRLRARPLAAGAGGALARPAARGRPAAAARHRDHLGARVRARDAGRPPLERLTIPPLAQHGVTHVSARRLPPLRGACRRDRRRQLGLPRARSSSRRSGVRTRRRTTTSRPISVTPARSRRTSRGRSGPVGPSPTSHRSPPGGREPRATMTCVSGTSALDGPVDVIVVSEEPGTGLGARIAGRLDRPAGSTRATRSARDRRRSRCGSAASRSACGRCR